jgi:multidrug transporter EmrE-like cation transporter
LVALAVGGLFVYEPLDALGAAAVALILTGVTMLRIRRAPAPAPA